MTLGQRIYNLRTERNLSQTDLAERLNVSRQSVSKWETDASVPDLDKLVKLCDLFEVSMDALVRGTEPDGADAEKPVVIIHEKRGSSAREIVGIALIALSILSTIILIVASRYGSYAVLGFAMIPLAVGGLICFVDRREIRLLAGGAMLILGIAFAVVVAVEGAEWKFLERLLALTLVISGAVDLIVKQ